MQIAEQEWIDFLNKQYSNEALYVPPNQLCTIGFLAEVEKFVIQKLGKK
jgi:hypothetical protein